jgi:hypothetical protein
MPYFDEELFKKNGASLISACSDQYSGIKYEVSFELDNNGLNNLQTALRSLETKDDMTQLKTELATMHGVNNSPGNTIEAKIDNYLNKKAAKPETKTTNPYYLARYQFKHRQDNG